MIPFTPPQNLDAEAAILGATMIDPVVVAEVFRKALGVADEIRAEYAGVFARTERFVLCNERVRDIIITACRLARLPSDKLDWLWLEAKRAWYDADAETRELEYLHGGLPPETDPYCTAKPSWKKS